MSVYEVLRAESSHEPQKHPKSPVAPIACVAYSKGGGMGKQDIYISTSENPVPKQLRYHAQDHHQHAELCVLIWFSIVSATSSDARYQQPKAFHDLAADIRRTE